MGSNDVFGGRVEAVFLLFRQFVDEADVMHAPVEFCVGDVAGVHDCLEFVQFVDDHSFALSIKVKSIDG